MTTPSTQELSRALTAVRERPEDFVAWDELEALAEEAQSPEPVAELYPEVLSRDLSPVSLKRLGERAVRFSEQWFADDAPLMQAVLLKVFELDPGDEAIFERLSVGLVQAGNAAKMLDLYTRAVDASDSLERQTSLLTEAVRAAREANDDDRAIGFMNRLLVLKPGDTALRGQLERLLDKNQRYRELITLRDAAARTMPAREAAETKVQIAELWLDKLHNPPAALDVLRKLLGSDPRESAAHALLERILASDEAALGTRREVMQLLNDVYMRTDRPLDAARVLRVGAGFQHGDERERLLRASANLFAGRGMASEALEDLGQLFLLRPDDEALAKEVTGQATSLGAHTQLLTLLLGAADRTKNRRRAGELRLRAATLAHAPIGDKQQAIELCERVFADDSDPELALDAGRALDALLEAQNSHEARIPVLERLSRLEPDAERKRELLGALAKLSLTRGDGRRAIATWQKRLQDDPNDREALDGVIALLEGQQDYEALVVHLRARAKLLGGEAAARDLSRIAATYADDLGDIEKALDTWRELHVHSPGAFDALELGPMLERAGQREADRGARILAGLGQAYMSFVGDAERALSFFARAVLSDASLTLAREGLEALLANDQVRARAAEALATAYASTGSIEQLVALLPHRLFGVDDPRQRATLLRQTAHLNEVRLEQSAAAFDNLTRALIEDPQDASSDAELVRLALQLEQVPDLVNALGQAASKLDAGHARTGQLKLLEAELSETRLGDQARAFAAYSAASRALPLDGALADALCRNAARLARFDAAFEVIIALAHKHDRVPEAQLALLEGEAQAAGALAVLCAAAENALNNARLTPPVRRALLARVAEWFERVEDTDAAERLLSTAAGIGGAPHVETLRKLAVLQRHKPGRPLFDTLIAISDLTEQDLDLLVEASELARDGLQEEVLFRAALERLLVRSAGLLASGRRAAGNRAAESCLAFAANELCGLLERNDAKTAVQVLRDAAALPVDAKLKRHLLERAGKVALEHGDRALAITLYERVLELAPDDAAVLSTLASEYDRAGRLDELLTVLRRELALTRVVPRRLELRLDIARVMGDIEARGARMAALSENLKEAPGHAASVSALEKALRERKLLPEIYDLFAAQGAQLEALGDTSRAAELWARAARFADGELSDDERSLTAFQKVAALRVDDEAYESLSRIRLKRGEPGLAVPWLSRRMARFAPEERTPVRLQLAEAQREAGNREAAIACLAEGIAEAPSSFALRDALASLYADVEMTEELAALLADSALSAPEPTQLLGYARRAAALYCDTLKQPERALEVLQRAIEVDPEDRSLRGLYADGLTAAGKLSEAKAVLDSLVLEFGRRRSPERAEVHVRLAHVATAAGDLQEALTQLDTASSMDRAHTGILRELGALALRAGEIERAERAYRALLMIVRKSSAEGGGDAYAAEVLYQLHRIASAQGQSERAAELLEQSVQAAVHSEAETARLKALLLERGEPALLIRVLELRLAQVNDPKTEAEVLSDLADVLEQGLNKQDEALDARLRALACAPESESLHEATLRVAEAANKLRKYVDVLRSLVERARRKEDAVLVGDLALRAGSILEHKMGDPQAAKELYQLVDASVPAYVEALTGLSRIAGKLRDADEERAVLTRIVVLPDSDETAPYKHEARYRIVELDARKDDTREAGLLALMALLSDAPDYARAATILKAVCEIDPRDPRALSMFEQIARKSGDDHFLLDYLERHAATDQPALGLLREGAELALSLDEGARAEKLLMRAIARAEEDEGLSQVPWAAVLLGRLYRKQGDLKNALDWFERALSVSDPFEAFDRGLELAELSASTGGDEERAIRLYDSLREKEPADRRVWAPLIELYRKQGKLDQLLALVRSTLDALIDPAERNSLRVETASLLFEANKESEGAALLQEVLAEDPDHQGATLTLADLYERRGENEALAELLRRKLEGAVQRHSPSVVPLSLRMGGLLAPTRPDQAAEVYREALNIVPDSDELLRVTISLLDPLEQASERAHLLERYLTGGGRNDDDALTLALWLLDHHIEGGDEEAVERSLQIASRIAPGSEDVSARLERWYRLREDYAHLAQYLEVRAHELVEGDRAIALLMEAAQIRLEQLGQPSDAALLLRKARERAPHDFALLKRAVHASAAAGDLGPAMAEVDAALDQAERTTEQRVELLLLRAEIGNLAGMHDEALASLDAAYALAPEGVAERLIAGLELAREAARERANHERERELLMRLVELQMQGGASERALELLSGWTDRNAEDRAAQRLLLELMYKQERSDEVIRVAEALIESEEPSQLESLATQLFTSAQRLGNLELARNGIEQAVTRGEGQRPLVVMLEKLYEQTGDKRALAALLGRNLSASGPAEKRAEELRRIGQLLLDAGDVEAALGPLSNALELKPDDVPTLLFIADAHIAAGRFQEAQDLLEHGMNAQKHRRSPELALLRQRMARLSDSAGDQEARLEWLNAALDADLNNGEIASETAVVAQAMAQYELALKALRAITMLKGETPMSRAEAFYRQAQIVAQKGEPRRAVLWAKKAKAEDANLPGVDALLAELGEA